MPTDFFYTNALLDIGFLLVPILIIKFVEKKELSLKQFGFKTDGALKDLLLTMKILVSLIGASFLIAVILTILGLNDLQVVSEVIGAVLKLPIIVIVYFFVVRIFLEEFFFRAFLVPRFGIVISSIIFGLAHLGYGSIAQAIGAGALGLILAFFYSKHKKILPNFLAHMLYNLFAISLWLI